MFEVATVVATKGQHIYYFKKNTKKYWLISIKGIYSEYILKKRGEQMMKNKKKEVDVYNNDGFYMKINKELKQQFNSKCNKQRTSMSIVLKEFIERYIQEDEWKRG